MLYFSHVHSDIVVWMGDNIVEAICDCVCVCVNNLLTGDNVELKKNGKPKLTRKTSMVEKYLLVNDNRAATPFNAIYRNAKNHSNSIRQAAQYGETRKR